MQKNKKNRNFNRLSPGLWTNSTAKDLIRAHETSPNERLRAQAQLLFIYLEPLRGNCEVQA